MNLTASILAISIAIVLYIYTIELFTILFRITGLTKEKARFQVISLITCSGFTTSEAEIIATNRRRRRLAIICMITGIIFNVMIISFIINLISSFSSNVMTEDLVLHTTIILGVAVALIVISKIPPFAKLLEKMTEGFARRLIYRNKHENTLTMLDLYGRDAIVEVYINNVPEALKDKTLEESELKSRYRINLLMLKRKNRTIEITKNTVIQKNDEIVVFGSRQAIKDLFTYKTNEVVEEEIIQPKENIITLIDNFGRDAMAQIEIHNLPEILKDKKLFESEIKTVYNLNVIMLRRNDSSIKVTKDTIIKDNDEIVIYGNYSNIKKIFINQNNE